MSLSRSPRNDSTPRFVRDNPPAMVASGDLADLVRSDLVREYHMAINALISAEAMVSHCEEALRDHDDRRIDRFVECQRLEAIYQVPCMSSWSGPDRGVALPATVTKTRKRAP